MTLNNITSFQTMSFDYTGNYLYYFDGNVRYLIDIHYRNVTNIYSTGYRQNYIAVSSKYGNEDITVTSDSAGHMSVWDDYGILYNYSVVGISSLVFT